MRTRARNTLNKENKKNLILDTAKELFLSNTSAIPTASSIAKSSSMTKGNLYTYFQSKEELFYNLLFEEYKRWFDEVLNIFDYSYMLEVRLFEDFYRNELLVKLNTLYHSQLKSKVPNNKKEKFENFIRENLNELANRISPKSHKTRTEVLILLYSSISLIIGSYQFESEFDDSFDSINSSDIYIPRLMAMWDIF